MAGHAHERYVFLNAPFDQRYQPLFRALLFAVHDCGFRARCALELGLFLGAKRFGDAEQRVKSCLILDREPYRYQQFCSDLAGQDVRAHGNRVERLIDAVRRWAETAPLHRQTIMPGGLEIARRYRAFLRALPDLCRASQLDPSELSFRNWSAFITGWLRAESEARVRRGR